MVGSSRKSNSGSPAMTDRHVQPTLLATGEPCDALGPLGGETDEVDDLGDRTRIRVIACVHRYQLLDSEIGVDSRGLQDDPDAGLELGALMTGVASQDPHLAGISRPVPLQDLYVVVFPAPLGPRSAKISPRGMSRLMPATAGVPL